MSASLILSILTAAAQLIPELEAAVPVITKAIEGQDLNDDDLTALDTVAQGLNAKVEAAAATVETPAPPAAA
jgi:hypothetical protein